LQLADYFFGIPVTLHSPLTVEECSKRITEAAKSSFWPFSHGVVGQVVLGYVQIRYRRHFGEYSAKPVLVGPIERDGDGSILNLKCRAPATAYVFFALWYGFLAMIWMIIIAGGWAPGLSWNDRAIATAGLVIFLPAMPLIIHAMGTLGWRADLAELIGFLETTVAATRRRGTA
jgi:hypothetical protein